jgi:hypothetical protein
MQTGVSSGTSVSSSRFDLLWKKNNARRSVPGTIKQVRGAAFPPPPMAVPPKTGGEKIKSYSSDMYEMNAKNDDPFLEEQPPEEPGKGKDRTNLYDSPTTYTIKGKEGTTPTTVTTSASPSTTSITKPLSKKSLSDRQVTNSLLALSISSSSSSSSSTSSLVNKTNNSLTTTSTENLSEGEFVMLGDTSNEGGSSGSGSSSLNTSRPTTALDDGVSPLKVKKFSAFLSQSIIDLDQLKKLSWSGVPPLAREITWKLLLGYLPANSDRRAAVLERKRRDYAEFLPHYFRQREEERTQEEQSIFHQIHVDILRTHPNIPLFRQLTIQTTLERILYMWAIKHPASSYVQGINELVTPFFVVFLTAAMPGRDVETLDISEVPADVLATIEADCYWCLSALLDEMHDHYTSDQPGIQRMIFKLKELIRRIDLPLYTHLEKVEVHYNLFAFRWMNCMLMREISLRLIMRMWDTYLSEPEGFTAFHVYVCAAFLTLWSDKLRQLEFQDIILFLQHVPTSTWTITDIETLLSKAYYLKALYHDSQAHLK